jgi:hypothetical protein
MKTVYIGHSRGFDYERELYEPVHQLQLDSNIEIILPHENGVSGVSTKELFQNGCDLFIAEVSYPATGLGMELAYADMLHIPIVCFSKSGIKISGSLSRITNRFVEYMDSKDLKEKIMQQIKELAS